MKASALLSADWHWRENKPLCRTDNDFIQTQIDKAKFADSICSKYNIPLLIAGDVFDEWKSSPFLLRIVLEYMPYFVCIPGNHDLSRHNLELYNKTNLSVVTETEYANVILDPNKPLDFDDFTLYGFPFGIEPKSRRKRRNEKPSICMLHTPITLEQAMFEMKNAYDVLEQLTGYDLILSGDNHTQFDIESNGRRLVNPGSVLRMDADQIDHKPAFYLWFAENNSIKRIEIPIKKDVVVKTHIELQDDRDKRIDDYIDSMKVDYSIKLDFKANLKEHMNANETEDNVKDIVWNWMEKQDG